MDKLLIYLLPQAGLIFRNPRTWNPPIFKKEPNEIIEMKHLFIPFFVLSVGHAVAWVLFMLEIVHALCKIGYYTPVVISHWYFPDKRRQAAKRQLMATQQQGDESQEQIEISEENSSGNEPQPDYDLIEVVE